MEDLIVDSCVSFVHVIRVRQLSMGIYLEIFLMTCHANMSMELFCVRWGTNYSFPSLFSLIQQREYPCGAPYNIFFCVKCRLQPSGLYLYLLKQTRKCYVLFVLHSSFDCSICNIEILLACFHILVCPCSCHRVDQTWLYPSCFKVVPLKLLICSDLWWMHGSKSRSACPHWNMLKEPDWSQKTLKLKSDWTMPAQQLKSWAVNC